MRAKRATACFSLVCAITLPLGAAIPGSFETNRGQADHEIQFIWKGDKFRFALTAHGAIMQPVRNAGLTVLGMHFVGGSASELSGVGPSAGIVNYLEGRDPSRWITGAPTYRRVRARGIWPGVDVEYHDEGDGVEYDLIVSPGIDPSGLQVHFDGVRHIRLDAAGDLILETPFGEIRQHRPVSFQNTHDGRQPIATWFVLETNDTVGFRLGAYDARLPLIIDPVIVYSSRLGIPGDKVAGVAVDAQGNVYVAGTTPGNAALPLPTTVIGGTTAYNHQEPFVTKISSDGKTALYRTYIGGSLFDSGTSIAVDGTGNAYVCGHAGPDFPTTPGAFQRTMSMGGTVSISFVLKLDPTGSNLVYSTYLAGSYGVGCSALVVDASGNVFVTGSTNSPDFVTTPGVFQGQLNSVVQFGQPIGDAFITKLNATGSDLIYSTFLGGSGGDGASGIAVDSGGNAYVFGSTTSTDFPTTPGALQVSSTGTSKQFVAKINPTGSALVYSTYLPETGYGNTFSYASMAADDLGQAYLAGITNCPNQANDMCDAVVTKLNRSGTDLVYSTTFGGTRDEYAYAIAVDSQGNAYVAGTTSSPNFPVTSDNTQPCGLFGQFARDAFIAKLDPAGSLVSATYLGGSSIDAPAAIALDAWRLQRALQRNTESSDFPVTTALGTAVAPLFLTKAVFPQADPGGVSVSCVANAADLAAGPVAPGEIMSVFGSGVGPGEAVFGQLVSGVLTSSVAGTQVLFDGVPGPLLYVQNRQVNAIVPYEVVGKTTVSLQVVRNGSASLPVTLPILPANPAIFTFSGTSIGQGRDLANEDGSLNSRSNPARRDPSSFFMGPDLVKRTLPAETGKLQLCLRPGNRFNLPCSLATSVALPNRTPQGEVIYAGPAPLLVAGVFAVVVRVPQDSASGDVPLQIYAPNSPVFIPSRVTVAIQ